MARSTGPILAAGAITLGNQTVFNKQSINWRIPIATGISAGMLALVERVSPGFAVGIAWIALVTVLTARVIPGQPTPVENALRWYEQGAK